MSAELRMAFARHEATHAVAAQKAGLTVAWVTIDPGHDEGICFGGATKIPDETLDMERDQMSVLIAMSAPSHVPSGSTLIDSYAELEATAVQGLATKAGLDYGFIYDAASRIAIDHYDEICDLSLRLVEEGTVSFDVQPA